MAKLLIGLGMILVIVGIVWLIFPAIFSWIGNLPGDIEYTSGNTRFYFPIVTMLVISIVATILLNF